MIFGNLNIDKFYNLVALDVVPTLVSRAFVDVELSARMLEADLCASVCQDIM